MSNYLRRLLVLLCFVLFILTILDTLTSFRGTLGILGLSTIEFSLRVVFISFISLVVSFSLVLFSILSPYFWQNALDANIAGISNILKPLHIILFVFDLFTSFFGIAEFVVKNNIEMTGSPVSTMVPIWNTATIEQKISILVMTAIVTISPVILGYIYPVIIDQSDSNTFRNPNRYRR